MFYESYKVCKKVTKLSKHYIKGFFRNFLNENILLCHHYYFSDVYNVFFKDSFLTSNLPSKYTVDVDSFMIWYFSITKLFSGKMFSLCQTVGSEWGNKKF